MGVAVQRLCTGVRLREKGRDWYWKKMVMVGDGYSHVIVQCSVVSQCISILVYSIVVYQFISVSIFYLARPSPSTRDHTTDSWALYTGQTLGQRDWLETTRDSLSDSSTTITILYTYYYHHLIPFLYRSLQISLPSPDPTAEHPTKNFISRLESLSLAYLEN